MRLRLVRSSLLNPAFVLPLVGANPSGKAVSGWLSARRLGVAGSRVGRRLLTLGEKDEWEGKQLQCARDEVRR